MATVGLRKVDALQFITALAKLVDPDVAKVRIDRWARNEFEVKITFKNGDSVECKGLPLKDAIQFIEDNIETVWTKQEEGHAY